MKIITGSINLRKIRQIILKYHITNDLNMAKRIGNKTVKTLFS
jgi:hypothetical protein